MTDPNRDESKGVEPPPTESAVARNMAEQSGIHTAAPAMEPRTVADGVPTILGAVVGSASPSKSVAQYAAMLNQPAVDRYVALGKSYADSVRASLQRFEDSGIARTYADSVRASLLKLEQSGVAHTYAEQVRRNRRLLEEGGFAGLLRTSDLLLLGTHFRETARIASQTLATIDLSGQAKILSGQAQLLSGLLADKLPNLSRLLAAETTFVHPDAKLISSMTRHAAAAVQPFGALPNSEAWAERLGKSLIGLDGPWALDGAPGLSAIGIARLMRLNDVARSGSPFSEIANGLFTRELGDGSQDEVRSPALERDEAAVAAGLQPDLIAFPPGEMGSVAIAAGFRFSIVVPPMPLVEDGDPHGVYDARLYAVLTSLEQHLRRIIESKLREVGGNAWAKQRAPGDMRKRWQERQSQAVASGRPKQSLIQYADFGPVATCVGIG